MNAEQLKATPEMSGCVISDSYSPLALDYADETETRKWTLIFWERPERRIELTGDAPTLNELIITLGHLNGMPPVILAEVLLIALHTIGKTKEFTV